MVFAQFFADIRQKHRFWSVFILSLVLSERPLHAELKQKTQVHFSLTCITAGPWKRVCSQKCWYLQSFCSPFRNTDVLQEREAQNIANPDNFILWSLQGKQDEKAKTTVFTAFPFNNFSLTM